MSNTPSKAEIESLAARLLAAEQATPKAAPGELVKQTVREQIAAEVATQPAAQVEFLARYLCERDSINPDQMLDDNPVRLAWHREDLNAARLLAKLAELAPQQEAQERVYLVNTGEVCNGLEMYERHEQPVPLADFEVLYTAPAPLSDDVVRDAAFESVRKKLCALPRYSFVLDDDGLVRRVQDRTGNWIEFDDAHELFDPVAVDAALAAQGGKA